MGALEHAGVKSTPSNDRTRICTHAYHPSPEPWLSTVVLCGPKLEPNIEESSGHGGQPSLHQDTLPVSAPVALPDLPSMPLTRVSPDHLCAEQADVTGKVLARTCHQELSFSCPWIPLGETLLPLGSVSSSLPESLNHKHREHPTPASSKHRQVEMPLLLGCEQKPNGVSFLLDFLGF